MYLVPHRHNLLIVCSHPPGYFIVVHFFYRTCNRSKGQSVLFFRVQHVLRRCDTQLNTVPSQTTTDPPLSKCPNFVSSSSDSCVSPLPCSICHANSSLPPCPAAPFMNREPIWKDNSHVGKRTVIKALTVKRNGTKLPW